MTSAGARDEPAPRIAKSIYVVHTGAGDATIPIETSLDLATAHPTITRAVIVFHGKGRDVEGYFHALERAALAAGPAAADTLLLAPQFLGEADADGYRLPDTMLRWHSGNWIAGLPATAPRSLSSFEVVDALLGTLADRGRFPNLHALVVAGHSAGAQLLNRYAIVSREPALLAAAGIHVRFVIANPSSYMYFSDDRPRRDGTFAGFHGERCPGFNRWKYGPAGAPAYAGDASVQAWQQRESAYAAADVIYLLGTADTDPSQTDLDRSCAGEAQGSERVERGTAYFRYLRSRSTSTFGQRLWFVTGVAHSGAKMIESACAMAALFEAGSCSTPETRGAKEHLL